MSIHITPSIEAAFKAYLDEPVDFYVDGAPILRRNTYPYNQTFSTGIVSFAAGYQARDLEVKAELELARMKTYLVSISEIAAERDALKEDLAEWRFTNKVDELGRHVDRLIAERNALRADAGRYRWMTRQIVGDTMEVLEAAFATFADEEKCTQQEFDAAIDAARAAT